MSEKRTHILLLILLGGIFYLPFLGGVHLFDWDEINFAEISREMLILKDYLRVYINFEPFWEKPPFFFWLQAGCMSLFGVGEYAARLPNAINGILSLVLIYLIGRKVYHARFGLLWAGAWLGSVLPFLYAKSGIIDPWFNTFIFLGLYGFILFYWKKESTSGISLNRSGWWYLIAGGLAIGLGILTKGPVAFLIAALCIGVYWVMQRFRWFTHPGHWTLYTLAAAAVMLIWYGLETMKNGPWFILEFNTYQYRLFSTPDAGHKGFPGYHFAVLLIGVFPASIFAVRSFFQMHPEDTAVRQDLKTWMKILFWVVLILFTIVRSKIVHYSSMCYFPMTYLAAVVLNQLWEGRLRWRGWLPAGLIGVGGLFILATLVLPWLGQHPELLRPVLAADPFGVANLDADVQWTGWEALVSLCLLAVLVSSIYAFKRKDNRSGVIILFLGTAIFVFVTLIDVIRNIEGYSQRAAIEFYEARQGEDCYVQPVGFKSYAHLFYTRKSPVTNNLSYDQNWLLSGAIDKPVYFVTRVGKEDRFEAFPDIREIGRKNGFIFLKRDMPVLSE
ncbi:MAG: glycosyltransferase family 39 protein [Saprospiraceae bacterium]|nr:glycosyltransferase family 39 protein [Saprospiraceae bacterium]